jgi:hypothetical protein
MTQEFIPYEQALALKGLGFDEPCIMYYDYSWTLVESGIYEYKAPLYQQAFRWFREKYNYCYFIRGNNYDGYYYDIDNLGMLRYKIEIDNRLTWKTYEEAELECLKKLIEIVKNK